MKKARGFSLVQTLHKSFSTFRNPSSQMDQSERYCFKPVLKWNPKVEEYFVKAYGAEQFARISQALTHPSCYSCIRVNTLKSTSDAVIQKLHAIVEEAGFGNASDINQAVMEPSLDGDACMENPRAALVSKCKIPELDYVVFVKGSGPHTIDYGYTHDKPPKEVIVSRKCAEAVLRGAQVYVPGVMACSAHVEKGDVVAVSVAVEQPIDGGWGINMTRGTVLLGNQNDPYYYECNSLYIGQGITGMSRAGIFRALEGIAVDMTNRVYRLPSFNDVLQGEIFLQNLPSIVTAHALDPQKGERILDMCAAPGGKTTAIAILMKDEGEVIAADRSHNKVLDIQKLAAELGLNCITTYKLDALKAICKRHESDDSIISNNADSNNYHTVPNSMNLGSNVEKTLCSDTAELSIDDALRDKVRNEKGNELTHISKADIRKSMRRLRNGPGRNQSVGGRVENSKGFPPHSFDRVLLDAPCSALGLRPRLFSGEDSIESLRNHGKYQRRMFDQAVHLVRSGGILVYSTCTINPGENEALVRYALDTYKFLSLAPQHPKIGGPGLIGHYQYPDGTIEEWLRPGEETLVQRFDPSSSLDTIGFFIAKFAVNHEM